MTLRSMIKQIVLPEHECNEDSTPDMDICQECGEHAGFCSICGDSNCCGARAVEMDRDMDMER